MRPAADIIGGHRRPVRIRADRLAEGDRIIVDQMGEEPMLVQRIAKPGYTVLVWFDVAPNTPLELAADAMVELVQMGRI